MTAWQRVRLACCFIALGAAVIIPNVVWIIGDLSDAANVAQIVSVPLAVISMLGLLPWPNRQASQTTNNRLQRRREQ